eukprot:151626-Ditylum_brightwellii.AAC.1
MFDLALGAFMESLRIHQSVLGKSHCDVAIIMYNIATVYYESGDEDEAIKFYEETLQVEKAALGADHKDIALTLKHLGQ